MKTNYSSYEDFLRTATGSEKDALGYYQRMDDFWGQDFLDREANTRVGAAINARLSIGWAGMTEEELLAESTAEIDRAVERAQAVVAELASEED